MTSRFTCGKRTLKSLLQFENFDFLKVKGKDIARVNKCKSLTGLATKVFIAFMDMLIDDLTENGGFYKFNTSHQCYMNIIENDYYDTQQIINSSNKIVLNGSNTMFIPVLFIKNKKSLKTKKVMVNSTVFDKIQENSAKGIYNIQIEFL